MVVCTVFVWSGVERVIPRRVLDMLACRKRWCSRLGVGAAWNATPLCVMWTYGRRECKVLWRLRTICSRFEALVFMYLIWLDDGYDWLVIQLFVCWISWIVVIFMFTDAPTVYTPYTVCCYFYFWIKLTYLSTKKKKRLEKSPCILFAMIQRLLVQPSQHKHHLLAYNLC